MSISDIKGKRAAKIALVYLCCSLFCALFSAVYEIFSHGVFSYYMLYAFAIPLVCGTLPFLIMLAARVNRMPKRVSLNLYSAGLATLTVGSLMNGVLEIYGTVNDLTIPYSVIGAALVAAGVIAYIVEIIRSKNTEE